MVINMLEPDNVDEDLERKNMEEETKAAAAKRADKAKAAIPKLDIRQPKPKQRLQRPAEDMDPPSKSGERTCTKGDKLKKKKMKGKMQGETSTEHSIDLETHVANLTKQVLILERQGAEHTSLLLTCRAISIEEDIAKSTKAILQEYHQEVAELGHDKERGPPAIRLAIMAAEAVAEASSLPDDAVKNAEKFLQELNLEDSEAGLQEMLRYVGVFKANTLKQKQGDAQLLRFMYKLHPAYGAFEAGWTQLLEKQGSCQVMEGVAPKGNLTRTLQTWLNQSQKGKSKGKQK